MHRSLSPKLCFTEKTALNSLLTLCSNHLSKPLQRISWNCISATRNETSPIQSKLCSYILPISIFTNQSKQDSAFWTNQTVTIWSLHLHEDRPIKDRGRNFFLYISFPVAQRAYFPFSLKAVSAWLGLKMAHQTKEQSRQNKAEWSRPELSSQRGALPQGCFTQAYLTPGPPHSHAIPQSCYNTTELFYSHAASQLSCSHWINFLFSLHLKIEDSFGHLIGTSVHQLT